MLSTKEAGFQTCSKGIFSFSACSSTCNPLLHMLPQIVYMRWIFICTFAWTSVLYIQELHLQPCLSAIYRKLSHYLPLSLYLLHIFNFMKLSENITFSTLEPNYSKQSSRYECTLQYCFPFWLILVPFIIVWLQPINNLLHFALMVLLLIIGFIHFDTML